MYKLARGLSRTQARASSHGCLGDRACGVQKSIDDGLCVLKSVKKRRRKGRRRCWIVLRGQYIAETIRKFAGRLLKCGAAVSEEK
jgi:hypothetical protein